MATATSILTDNAGVPEIVERVWQRYKHVVPCGQLMKHPPFPWTEWQTKPPTLDDLRGWATFLDTWAIITGPASGVLGIDLDGPEGLRWAEAHGLDDFHTLTPGGGGHIWVAWPEGLKIRNKVRLQGAPVDVRAQNGLLVFCGPGRTVKRDPEDLVLFEALPAALREALVEPPRKPAGRETHSAAPHATAAYNVPNCLTEARRRLDAGSTRNETGFWVATQLRDLRLDKEEARPFLDQYQQAVETRGDHEYTHAEAEASLESAYSQPPREYPETAAAPAADENALAGAIGTPVWALDAGAAEFLIDPFIELGTVTMLTGPPAAGKSFLSLAIATCLIHGEPFAGFPTRPARVLYVDRENPPKRIQERLAAVGFEPRRGDERRFAYWGPWAPEAPEGPDSKRILAWVKANPGCLVVFDSYVRFFRGKEADPNDTAKFFALIDRLKAAGATVLILHHTGKAESAQDYRGSSDLLAAVDAMYKVKATYRTEPDPERPWRSRKVLATLTLKETKTRSGYEAEPTLRFVAGVGFVQDGGAATEAGEDDPITDFVRDHGEATRADIVEKFGERAYKKWKDALPETIERTETKNGNLPGSAVYRWSERGL